MSSVTIEEIHDDDHPDELDDECVTNADNNVEIKSTTEPTMHTDMQKAIDNLGSMPRDLKGMKAYNKSMRTKLGTSEEEDKHVPKHEFKGIKDEKRRERLVKHIALLQQRRNGPVENQGTAVKETISKKEQEAAKHAKHVAHVKSLLAQRNTQLN
jgi:hypothetical protein